MLPFMCGFNFSGVVVILDDVDDFANRILNVFR